MKYVKDYRNILACIPTAAAEAMVSVLGAEDGVDTVCIEGGQIFQDDLLFLFDLPLDKILSCIQSWEALEPLYPSIYAGYETPEDKEAQFEKLYKPILLLRVSHNL